MRYLLLLCLFCLPLHSLTLEEKIGQLFIVHFHGEEANEEARQLIQQMKVGGFIYYNFSNGLQDPAQVKRLSEGLQSLAAEAKIPPLFLAVDQEGGRVARLKNGFITVPPARELAETKTPEEVEALAETVGTELHAVGINLNFAPVVDVDSNPASPIIGNRSFGRDPETVIRYAGAFEQGLMQAGVFPCLKHFPGHGDTAQDSHETLPVVNKAWEELRSVELEPYYALAPTAPLIMSAHVLYPALDPKNCATLSSIILIDLLREEIGFEGVLITDSLLMQGVLPSMDDLGEVALRAFEAGNDLLLIGGRRLNEGEVELREKHITNLLAVKLAFVKAVESGRLTEARIDASLERILKLKNLNR